MFKPSIYKWFTKEQVTALIKGDVSLVIEALAEQQVVIKSGGLWNVKAPDPVLFTNKAFILSTRLNELAYQSGNIILKEGFIGFKSQRLSIVFEE